MAGRTRPGPFNRQRRPTRAKLTVVAWEERIAVIILAVILWAAILACEAGIEREDAACLARCDDLIRSERYIPPAP